MMLALKKISVVLATTVAVCTLPSVVFAASCVEGASKAADTEISSFLSDPGAALSSNPVGGLALANVVRSLVTSSSDTLNPVIELVKGANDDQAKSIGSGLARAVSTCAKVDAAYADSIQQAIAALGNAQLIAGFASTSDEIRTAAIGAAAAGPGGGTIGALGGLSAANGFVYPGDVTARMPAFEFSAGSSGQITVSAN